MVITNLEFWGYQRDIENTRFTQTYIYRVNEGLT